MIPFIAVACAEAGFKVASKGWEKASNKLRFFCQQSRAHDDKKVRNKIENNDKDRGLKHSHLSDGRLGALGKAQFEAVQQ